ncbi:uncharacterized protein LOC120349387, partial [Nilaparvata lugens]|uniref:uncharacterized protein LOC120349387 n=1 Tax=Nilaparvata lugens TaxID=108931 RepID=UPI00193D4D3C
VHGLVNGIRFDPDSVLLSERYQTVNGHYLFGPETVLDVEDIISNSLVDGVNITYLLDQQVCKDDTNHLITGSKRFRSRFSVANQVEMRRHFNDIDLVQLHNQLMSPYEGLAKDNRLTALASIRKDVELSLATRAHLFTGWEKVTQVAGRIRLALPLDGRMERVVFVGRFTPEEVRMRLSLNYWDVRGRRFVETDKLALHIISDERRFFMKRPLMQLLLKLPLVKIDFSHYSKAA